MQNYHCRSQERLSKNPTKIFKEQNQTGPVNERYNEDKMISRNHNQDGISIKVYSSTGESKKNHMRHSSINDHFKGANITKFVFV